MAQGPSERMSEPKMDAAELYREEIFTDRKVGSIRTLVPVKSDGSPDSARAIIYAGETQIMTHAGPLPINFEIEAASLGEAAREVRRCRQGSHRAHGQGTAGIAPPGGLLDRRPGSDARREVQIP